MSKNFAVEDELRGKFQALREMWRNPAKRPDRLVHIWSDMHQLAEARYAPAQELFEAGLEDADWQWREYCVDMLGFHYVLPWDGPAAAKFRRMLNSDPSSSVRLAAAGALGQVSRWPDEALQQALETEPERQVRVVVFSSLLTLAGVGYAQRREAVRRVETGEAEPTWEALTQTIGAFRRGTDE